MATTQRKPKSPRSSLKTATPTLAHVHATEEGVASVELTPPHPPREETPAYRAAHQFLIYEQQRPCLVCGVTQKGLRSKARNPHGAKQMESHHYPLERSLAHACDPAKVHRLAPSVYDRATLDAWVDSPANLIVLCLVGETPILMADGAERPIKAIQVGDYLVGHDGKAHRVTATMHRHVEEDIVEVDGVRMTGNHPVLTTAGWVRADRLVPGQIVGHIGVVVPQVLGLARTEFQVFDAIVRAVPVDMVHALHTAKGTPQVVLHHPAVFHHGAPALQPLVPVPASAVALGCNLDAAQASGALARGAIQADHAAGIRAVAGAGLLGALGREPGATDGTGQCCVLNTRRLSPIAAALPGAGGVAVGDMARHSVVVPADGALLGDGRVATPALDAWWSSVNHVRHLPFYGTVYNIELEGSHSYVAASTIVHNCDVHHRSPQAGIHHLLVQDWAVLPYLYDHYVIAATQGTLQAALAADEAIERAVGLEPLTDPAATTPAAAKPPTTPAQGLGSASVAPKGRQKPATASPVTQATTTPPPTPRGRQRPLVRVGRPLEGGAPHGPQ